MSNWGGGVLALSPKRQEREKAKGQGATSAVKEQPDLWGRWGMEWRMSRSWKGSCRHPAMFAPGSSRTLVSYILSVYFVKNGRHRLQLTQLSKCSPGLPVHVILLNPFLMKGRRLYCYSPILKMRKQAPQTILERALYVQSHPARKLASFPMACRAVPQKSSIGRTNQGVMDRFLPTWISFHDTWTVNMKTSEVVVRHIF